MERCLLSAQKAPVPAGVVREKTPQAAIEAIGKYRRHGADAIDLHLSCLEPAFRTEKALCEIKAACPIPLIALNYNQNFDRTDAGMSEEERLALLVLAVRAGADAVDLQGYSFDPASRLSFDAAFRYEPYSFICDGVKEIVVNPSVIEKQKAFIADIHAMGAQVMLSNHPGVYLTTIQVLDWVHFLEDRNPDVIKIVLAIENEDQLAESFATMLKLRHEKIPVSMHCSGYGTKYSRIINPILGGHIAFCIDGAKPYDDINQLDISEMSAAIEHIRKLL